MTQMFEGDPFGGQKAPVKENVVSPQKVNEFHKNSDVDTSVTSQHHTLGIKANQASPGDHIHDGRSSKKILEGVTITGDRSDGTALLSIINILVNLGATDSTVA